MSAHTLDTLLAKLNAGEAEAAERVFREYEPYLRVVVRRRLSRALRAKFDSVDVVQSVWADVLDGLRRQRWNFDTADQLRAFLVKMTRNRLIDGVRHHRGALEREVRLSGLEAQAEAPDRAARASEELYADELWQQMLAACPPAHRAILTLKRQGVALAEIAAQTGLHEGSVRRILYDVARRVARRRASADPSKC
jgi:RNA polymerase sigma-70 factor (ECF subfamily)